MKKKIYLIVSSLIGILISLYSLITLNIAEIIKSQLEVFNNIFDNNIPQNILNIINNHAFYYFTIIFGIILLLLILIISIKGNISKNKVLLIVLSVLLLLFSDNVFFIGFINILVLMTVKRFKNNEVKESLPVLEEPIRDKATKTKSVFIILFYLFLLFILPEILNIFIKDIPLYLTVALNIAVNIILIIAVFVLFGQEIWQQFKIFYQKFKLYLPKIFTYYALSLFLMFIANVIIMLLKGDIQESQNQLSLSTLPFWYLLMAAVIYAPIVEETVFRGSIRILIKNDKLFIIISAISFGLLHTLGQEANLVDSIIMAIPYMAMGYVLARTYVKTNNICSNMALHSLNNLIAAILLLFV